MSKPIEVARQEFIDGMIGFINKAALPSFMVAEVMEKILPAVKANIDKEYDRAQNEYSQMLAAEKQRLEEQRAAEEKKSIDEGKGGDPKKEPVNDNEDKKRGGLNGGRQSK